jgi:hypothetical protein
MMLSRPITLDDQLNAPVDIEPNRTERLLPLEDGATRRLEPDVPQPPAGGGVSGVRRRRRLVYLLAFGVAALLFSATVPDPGAKVDGRGDRVAGATGKVETAPSENAPAAMPPAADQGIPVTVAQVSRQDVAIYRTGLGSVQAFNTVAVTSRSRRGRRSGRATFWRRSMTVSNRRSCGRRRLSCAPPPRW